MGSRHHNRTVVLLLEGTASQAGQYAIATGDLSALTFSSPFSAAADELHRQPVVCV
jgi:hypothetical protein